jgi:hypothetical protein
VSHNRSGNSAANAFPTAEPIRCSTCRDIDQPHQVELRHRNQQHAVILRDEREHLPCLPSARRAHGSRDRYLEPAR